MCSYEFCYYDWQFLLSNRNIFFENKKKKHEKCFFVFTASVLIFNFAIYIYTYGDFLYVSVFEIM